MSCEKTIRSFSLQYHNRLYQHCLISVRIRCYSCPHFPVFGLDTERYSVSGVILVRIFLYSDWIRRGTSYLSVFSPNARKCIQDQLQIWTLFSERKNFKFSDQASLVTFKSSSYSSLIHVLMNQNFKHNRQHLPADSVWKKFPYMKNKGFFYFLLFDEKLVMPNLDCPFITLFYTSLIGCHGIFRQR